MKKPGGVFMQLYSKCNANAMQFIPIKSNDCNSNKKKDFPAIHILHILHTNKKKPGTARNEKQKVC